MPAGFVTTIVMVELPPTTMLAGLKLFVTVGGTYTFTVSVAGLPLLPAFVCRSPAAIVFVAAPAVLLVTVNTTVQPPAGMLVPFATVKSFAVALTPVHVPPGVPGFVIVMPVGIVSVNALVNVIATRFVFPKVTVKVVVPPLARFAAAKSFVIEGGARTVRFAVLETAPAVVI